MPKLDNNKIKQFPITYSQRRKNSLGPLHVECQISGRYLKFYKNSSMLQGGEFITLDVMATPTEDGKASKKICQMIVTREDLIEALNNITPKE